MKKINTKSYNELMNKRQLSEYPTFIQIALKKYAADFLVAVVFDTMSTPEIIPEKGKRTIILKSEFDRYIDQGYVMAIPLPIIDTGYILPLIILTDPKRMSILDSDYDPKLALDPLDRIIYYAGNLQMKIHHFKRD